MKNLIAIFLCLCIAVISTAQTAVSFVDFQKTLPRPNEAMKRKEDTLQKQFKARGLEWPAKYVYLRSFKYDSQLEVWVKNERKEPFKLFKTYKVCALAGSLGPKRMQGDYQVPEGFYYINEFNPNSTYYLSLGINYTNASDKVLSDSLQPGGDIYIHGSCVTTGCIPITDQQIDEVYTIAAYAKGQGQDFIPVHIFPIRYSNKKSAEYLSRLTKSDAALKTFSERLEAVYDHFEATHQLPVIMINNRGDYVYDGLSKKVPPPPPIKKTPVPHRTKVFTDLADAVHMSPQFPGGVPVYMKYLETVGKAMSSSLPENVKKAYVTVEFVIDNDGTPYNFKVVKGVNDDFNDELITALESMPAWQPALLNDKPVAKKILQSFVIEP
jgi:murein L,D-transpeptidase YafK